MVMLEVEALPSVVCPVTFKVDESVVAPVAERLVAVVVARVEVPDAVSVPFEVSEVVKTPSVARRSAVKKDPVEVALVKDADTAFRSVVKSVVTVPTVVDEFPNVDCPVTERVPPTFVLPLVVRLVADALVRVVCPVVVSVPFSVVLPVTMREDAVVLPVVEVPEMRVEKVPVVKDGLGVILIVLVPEKRTLAPATKVDTGEL